MSAPLDRRLAAVRDGSLLVRKVLEEHLAVIAGRDPDVHAWVMVDADGARRAADAFDGAVRTGVPTGPLTGVILGVKDIFDVAGMPTRAGSTATRDRPAQRDAGLVSALRGAGALVLGKTTTTEWAASDAAPTRNPLDAGRTAGGSSTGSAVAIATGMCSVATATQTAGSLVRPAAYNGAAGLLPTPGWVSTDGLIPSAWSLDTPGLMAARIADLATVYAALIGRSAASCSRVGTVSEPEPFATGRPHFGWVTALARRADGSQQQAMSSLRDRLERAGATGDDVDLPGDVEDLIADHWTVLAAETATHHLPRFRSVPDSFGPGIRSVIESGMTISATAYVEALRRRVAFQGRLHALLGGYDALVSPGAQGEAPKLSSGTVASSGVTISTGDPAMQMPWTFGGCPIVVFPIPTTPRGLPLAAQFVGSPGAESHLLALASSVEALEIGNGTDLRQ